MKIAHIGPPLCQAGGPAGYLRALQLAFEAGPSRPDLEVLFPEPAVEIPTEAPRWVARRRSSLSRLKRTLWGAPKQFRPSLSECAQSRGPIGRLIDESTEIEIESCRASFERAEAAGVDVCFTHSASVAKWVGTRTSADVWLMLHSPIPSSLYLAWAWGLPEEHWQTILRFDDVRAGIDRELDACDNVARLWIPCSEALDELVRVEPRFEAFRRRIGYLLTGADAEGCVGPSMSEARSALSLPLDEPLALFLGSRQPYRGLQPLLDALEHLGNAPGRLVVAGPPEQTMPRHPRVIALGRVSNVPRLLSAVDFLVNTNLFSLFDLSNVEAAAAAKPLLLSSTGGNRTLARLGAGVVPIEDLEPASIASSLEGMFRMSDQELARLGEASRRCYQNHLTAEHARRRHEHAYTERCNEVAS